jgi:hypothetical protein
MSASPSVVKDLKPSSMQTWTLIGLSPIHRGLVMKTVRSLPSVRSFTTRSSGNTAGKTQLQWTHIDLLSLAIATRKQSWKLGEKWVPGIIVMNKDILNEINSSELLDWFAGCFQSVLLLWSWSGTGSTDNRWATELGFAGVIHDMVSLEQWLRSCLRSGPVHTSVASPLLADISLPQVRR